MFTGILITDGGPHPADKWAVFIAERIVPTDNVKIGSRPALALRLQLAVAEAIEDDFAKIQADEQQKLAADPEHLFSPHETDTYVSTMMMDIATCAAGSPWEDHYKSPVVQDEIRSLLTQHVKDTMHIERSWHTDRNPDLEQSKRFKAALYEGVI